MSLLKVSQYFRTSIPRIKGEFPDMRSKVKEVGFPVVSWIVKVQEHTIGRAPRYAENCKKRVCIFDTSCRSGCSLIKNRVGIGRELLIQSLYRKYDFLALSVFAVSD